MLGSRFYMDQSFRLCVAYFSAVWCVEWLKHLGAGLLFKKKKQSVECSADSQKVMQCFKG